MKASDLPGQSIEIGGISEGYMRNPTDEQVAPPFAELGLGRGLSSIVRSSGQKSVHLAKSEMISAHSVARLMR
ncbi:hypothetical protein ACNJX9_25370 [Bradyrhizobium sp. DASA03076]|uniref:hypothetical protein n=1 Tax=Bradyrhizobium sp. BLXBL-03 TaxID=3395916 RepID=UPI003F7266A3